MEASGGCVPVLVTSYIVGLLQEREIVWRKTQLRQKSEYMRIAHQPRVQKHVTSIQTDFLLEYTVDQKTISMFPDLNIIAL